MSTRSLGQLSQATQQKIADMFQLKPETFTELNGYESIVFSTGNYVIKVYDVTSRTKNELLAELLFVNHLAEQGVQVAQALPAKSGELVEAIADYFVVKFDKAKGESPEREDASPGLFKLMGKTLGNMHAASKLYESKEAQMRNAWFQDDHIKNWDTNLDEDDIIKPIIKEQLVTLQSLETQKDAYGLIHADFHSDNFLVQDGSLTVIDFGDCLYGWFAMDIATALFYFRRFLEDGHKATAEKEKEYASFFYRHLIKGYLKKNTLSNEWLERIPDFLLWRYIDLYLYLSHLKQSGDLDEDEHIALVEFKGIILNKNIMKLDWVRLAR